MTKIKVGKTYRFKVRNAHATGLVANLYDGHLVILQLEGLRDHTYFNIDDTITGTIEDIFHPKQRERGSYFIEVDEWHCD
jgi:hypothetical protein